jgi:small-conductance mechanosensitive channel
MRIIFINPPGTKRYLRDYFCASIAKASGMVKEIQIFSTIMETNDKKTIIVPNSKITADKIVIHRK